MLTHFLLCPSKFFNISTSITFYWQNNLNETVAYILYFFFVIEMKSDALTMRTISVFWHFIHIIVFILCQATTEDHILLLNCQLAILFGKGIIALITVGLAAIIVEALTGFVLIPGLATIEEGFQTVGTIAIVLAGAFPLVFVLTKLLKKPLLKLGGLLGINDIAAAGLIATLANSIATFGMVKDMDYRGKVVNMAFAVSAAFVFGDHLGFAAGFAPEMLPSMIVGKLAGGISAVAVALLLTRQPKSAA